MAIEDYRSFEEGGNYITGPIKLAKNAPVGSAEYKAAQDIIEKLAKEPGAVGTFLQKMGGSLGDKVIKTIDEIPLGPFKGMKNTIKSYFELLWK